MLILNRLKLNLNFPPVVGITGALVALVFFTFCHAFVQWHEDWKIAHQMPVTVSVTMQDDAGALITGLPQSHLFGQNFAKNGDMPISNLQLHITGIVKINGDQRASKVYISMADQPGKIYLIGDQIAYDVKVYAITANSVILENDGHLEKLLLSREKLQFKPQNKGEGLFHD